MHATTSPSLLHCGLQRLIGPLSVKELRVTSRRRRSYALRSGYLVLLCLVMLSVWYRVVGLPALRTSFGVSRASAVSAQVAGLVIAAQFMAAQLVAALTLSSSMADEVRRGSLGVLLTTPITSVHIVTGKLLGALLQIVLLCGIGLPALAALRVLGGLSWEDVFAAFWVTLTAAAFAASVSLLLSTYYRRPLQAIAAGAVVYLVLFVGLPFAGACLSAAGALNQPLTESIIDLTNPFHALACLFRRIGRISTPGMGGFFSWPIHCLLMVGATAVVTCASVRRVRRVAVGGRFGRGRTPGILERLWGSPVAWKEDPSARLLRKRTVVIIIVALGICLLALQTRGGLRGPRVIYPYYALPALWLMMFLRLAMATAGSIAAEKESGAWPVLLLTPLETRDILGGKVRAAWRRDGVLLLALLATEMCVYFSQGAIRDPLLVTVYVLGRLGAVVLVLGVGLYFGVRLRTTTAAVTAALVTFLGVNYFLLGAYNPLSSWWLARIVANYANRGSYYLQFYSLTTVGIAFGVDLAVGLSLWRRAGQKAREYVF